MAEQSLKKPGGLNNNKSNTIRSAVFTFLLLCFGVLLVVNMNKNNIEKVDVPISDVIQRVNDPEGN